MKRGNHIAIPSSVFGAAIDKQAPQRFLIGNASELGHLASKLLVFSGATSGTAAAGMTLVGQGEEAAIIRYDVIEPSGELSAGLPAHSVGSPAKPGEPSAIGPDGPKKRKPARLRE